LSGSKHQILYDADCRFCRWSLGWVLRWDRAERLRPVALQDPEAESLLAEMPEARRRASWHLVDRAGCVRSAGAAALALLDLLPAGRGPGMLFARFPGVAERSYQLVARHRSHLSRWILGRSISRADKLIAERDGHRSVRDLEDDL
jgi:predicted DCC family thiol-disulfide oxidoreductase YuxK